MKRGISPPFRRSPGASARNLSARAYYAVAPVGWLDGRTIFGGERILVPSDPAKVPGRDGGPTNALFADKLGDRRSLSEPHVRGQQDRGEFLGQLYVQSVHQTKPVACAPCASEQVD